MTPSHVYNTDNGGGERREQITIGYPDTYLDQITWTEDLASLYGDTKV